jgi:hypothetical protein
MYVNWMIALEVRSLASGMLLRSTNRHSLLLALQFYPRCLCDAFLEHHPEQFEKILPRDTHNGYILP